MQINRLFEMVYLLMSKKDQKKMTAKELADHFEVSQRTVYRDIEILNGAGIPVAANKGKNGGIELSGNYLLDASAFSERERSEIVFALQSFRALKYVNADNVLKKLSAIFNQGAIDWIEVDFSDWSAGGKEKFNIMKNAVVHKKCLSFDYFGSNGEKTHRTVFPVQLWFKHRAWYIKAFCLMRRDYRVFKVSRIKNLSMSTGESNFEIADLYALIDLPAGRDLDAPRSGGAPPEKSGLDVIREKKAVNNVDLKLRIDKSLGHRVFDEFDEEGVTADANGNFLVSAIFPEDEWLYGYILSFNDNLEVLEPLYFRDKIIEKLKKTLGKYM